MTRRYRRARIRLHRRQVQLQEQKDRLWQIVQIHLWQISQIRLEQIHPDQIPQMEIQILPTDMMIRQEQMIRVTDTQMA